jgi:hypothetical protein
MSHRCVRLAVRDILDSWLVVGLSWMVWSSCSVNQAGLGGFQLGDGNDGGPTDVRVFNPDTDTDAVGPPPPLGTGGGTGSGTGGLGVRDAGPDATGTGGGGGRGVGTGGTGRGGAAMTGGMSGVGGQRTGGSTGTGGAGTAGRGGTGVGGSRRGGMGGGGAGGGAGGNAGVIGAAGAGGRGGTSPSCSPASCANGCCAGDVCVLISTARQCGRAGAACVRCAACQRCAADGSCELDPASHWALTAGSAALAPRKTDGSLWDGLSGDVGGVLPDPLVELEVPLGNLIGRATTLNDTIIPNWNESLQGSEPSLPASALLPGADPWVLWVGDQDTDTAAELMCEIDTLTAADFSAGGFTRSNVGSCIMLTVRLTCQP